VVLRQWIPRSADRWAAEAVRLLMEVAVIRKMTMTRITTRRRMNMMKMTVHPLVIRTMEKKKKTTTRIMTKITMKTKKSMAIALIPAMRRKKSIIMTGAVPGILPEVVVLPAVVALPVAADLVAAVPPVAAAPLVAAIPPAAVVPPEEDSPVWIEIHNAASPAREHVRIMRKEEPMGIMREVAVVAAIVAAATVPAHHPVRVPVPPTAAARVLPEEVEARAAIHKDSSPAAADALAMAVAVPVR